MKTFSRWIIACLAALAFVAPLKFGTPVVIQAHLTPPSDSFEWLLFSWPNQIAMVFAFAALLWLVLDSERQAARVDALFLLPAVFLVTQVLATPNSINRQISVDTLMHFTTCILLFYAAAWYARDGAAAARIFGGLALATFLAAIVALRQYFGGLQETRDFAALYADQSAMPRDMLLRMTSNRVFATFGGYPNALAGYLAVACVPTLAWIWGAPRTLWNRCIATGFACGLMVSAVLMWSLSLAFGALVFAPILVSFWEHSPSAARRLKWTGVILASLLMSLALVFTGSRGGFMAFGVMILAGLLCLIPGGAKRGLGIGLALLVLAGLFLTARQAGLIGLGRSSAEARTDYWRGASAIARDHFWLGTGPGTFGSIYPKYKVAQTEEAQLVHNNFLQMWSDSGLPALIVFAALWLVALKDSLALAAQRRGDVGAVAVCAALTGWVVHGLVDFDLYVPGIAIPAFLLLGILQGLKELPSAKPVAPKGNIRWAVGLACAAVVGAVVWIEGHALAANFSYGRAKGWLDRSDPLAALHQMRVAVALSPDNGYYRAVAGNLALRLRRFDEAIGHYQAAVRNDPFRASYHWGLAQAEIRAHGITRKALDELRQATALNPTQRCDDPTKPCYRLSLAEAEESVRQSTGNLLESSPSREK